MITTNQKRNIKKLIGVGMYTVYEIAELYDISTTEVRNALRYSPEGFKRVNPQMNIQRSIKKRQPNLNYDKVKKEQIKINQKQIDERAKWFDLGFSANEVRLLTCKYQLAQQPRLYTMNNYGQIIKEHV